MSNSVHTMWAVIFWNHENPRSLYIERATYPLCGLSNIWSCGAHKAWFSHVVGKILIVSHIISIHVHFEQIFNIAWAQTFHTFKHFESKASHSDKVNRDIVRLFKKQAFITHKVVMDKSEPSFLTFFKEIEICLVHEHPYQRAIVAIGKYKRFKYCHTTFETQIFVKPLQCVNLPSCFQSHWRYVFFEFHMLIDIYTLDLYEWHRSYIGVINGYFNIVVEASLRSNVHKLEFLWISLKWVVCNLFHE